MDWFKAHKALLGTITGAAAAIAHTVGQDQLAVVITTVSSFLLGGGLVKSDQFYKDRQ